MRSVIIALLYALPALALASENPIFASLDIRQEPGSPKYACHEDCGTVISLSRSDGFCQSDAFSQSLSDCLDCALEYDIWKHYEAPVTRAAKACDLDATPREPSSTLSKEPSTTGSATPTPTPSAPAPAEPSSTGVLSESLLSSEPPTTTSAISGGYPSSTLPTSTGSSDPPAFTGAASHVFSQGVGNLGLVLVGLMAIL